MRDDFSDFDAFSDFDDARDNLCNVRDGSDDLGDVRDDSNDLGDVRDDLIDLGDLYGLSQRGDARHEGCSDCNKFDGVNDNGQETAKTAERDEDDNDAAH